MSLSHFDEKSGVVYSEVASEGFRTRWYQTVSEVVIEVRRETEKGEIRAKAVSVVIKPKRLAIKIDASFLLEGEPHDVLSEDESTWTIEDRQLLRVQLCKAKQDKSCWPALLKNDEKTKANAHIFHEMRKKIDLELFQIENPGFDFSSAKLDKRYEERGLKEAAKALEEGNH